MSSLPPELLHVLNQAYFLHLLATDPGKAIPPGKSLLSMMARAPAAPEPSPLHATVEKVVHKAFWDEALLSLSSPTPSVQLPRLKLLYSDLRDALLPLFPPEHPILLTLAAPLPPTSSPLHSTLALVKEILAALRQRCAPARDPEIDALLADLAPPPASSDTAQENPLAALLVSTLRALITLADTLKRDLTNSLLGAMSESQLTTVIRQQARAREHEIILDPAMWSGEDGKAGIETLRRAWTEWIGAQTEDAGWTPRLLQAFASPTPVTCQPSNPNPNALPPQFFFSRPSLLYIQNYLQALVVAASLKALVRLPATATDFMSRIWSLLKAEIDRDEYPIHTGQPDKDDLGAAQTKIINLADEVIRARRLFTSASPQSEDEELKLRAAVERTLQLTDPVFMLLQGRLLRAIEQRIREALSGSDKGPVNGMRLPEKMRTGRVPTGTLHFNDSASSGHSTPSKAPSVKGFEDEVLVRGIEEVFQKVLSHIEWVESVWGDTILKSSLS
ncbi:hypothetical protein D9615_004479 [Tricholomella constricta]|uniref:Uncharacterized protein n=1 Tax=Tricholomella constricta TaxID=117010 RepID=A0A8H5HC23_9AGAR|nr:hypothetical protein D9615_004479 [Tricholomella constricta]